MTFDILTKTMEDIEFNSTNKLDEIDSEIKSIQELNPYNINDELASNGFIATYDGLFREYATSKDGVYYLKIARDVGKKFKINYSWCIKEEDSFNVVSEIYSTTKTIFEEKPQRNKLLGKYTEDYNIPRGETVVASFLDDTWKLIINATDLLAIFKDKETTVTINKYSSNHILHEFCTLSEEVEARDYSFRLLYVKDKDYTLFMHDNCTNEDTIVGEYLWEGTPLEISQIKLHEMYNPYYEDLAYIDTELDMDKLKEELLNSLIVLGKDLNKKMKILDNRSKFIDDYLTSVISTLRGKYFDNLNKTIKELLSEHKSPSKQMLADYLNASGEFYIVHDIKKRFKKTPQGFVEITPQDVSNFFNKEFGYNKVSLKRCYECMDYITRELAIDYDIVQFQNGLYNTRTCTFTPDEFASEYIPKLNLANFSYVENAKDEYFATNLYDELHSILKTDREHWRNWNEEIFYKSVGSCYSGVNFTDKMFVIVGKSWSRKSTLLCILKRVFNDNYCNKKIQEIVKNERFVLIPTVNKAILIDDDASDLQLNNIGNLNSFISGTGLYVEFKNANDGVHLNENNTPRIWCASNELFNVVGSGFKRRLCLILCDNVFDRDKSSKEYMVAINNGERDKELELLISYSLQLFASGKDGAFLTQEQEDCMYDEFEFRSYPERKFVETVFQYGDDVSEELEQSLDDNNISELELGRWSIQYKSSNNTRVTIPTILKIKDATTICRKFFRYQLEKGTMFESHVIPSAKRIKTAMEMFGFNQTIKNTSINGSRSSIRVYENIVIKQEWITKLGLESLMDSIIEEDITNTVIIKSKEDLASDNNSKDDEESKQELKV